MSQQCEIYHNGQPTPCRLKINHKQDTWTRGPSMIHSARPTFTPVAITDIDKTCENSDHYRPRLWVGLVDQLAISHTLSIDPLGLPTNTTCSDHYFHPYRPSVRLPVRTHFSKWHKTKQFLK